MPIATTLRNHRQNNQLKQRQLQPTGTNTVTTTKSSNLQTIHKTTPANKTTQTQPTNPNRIKHTQRTIPITSNMTKPK